MIMMNFVTERLFIAGQCVAIAELAYREKRFSTRRSVTRSERT